MDRAQKKMLSVLFYAVSVAACPAECESAQVSACFAEPYCNSTGFFTVAECEEARACGKCFPLSLCSFCPACGEAAACFEVTSSGGYCDANSGTFVVAACQTAKGCSPCFAHSPCATAAVASGGDGGADSSIASSTATENSAAPGASDDLCGDLCAPASSCFDVAEEGGFCDAATGIFTASECIPAAGCASCFADSPCAVTGGVTADSMNHSGSGSLYTPSAPGCTLMQQEAGCALAQSCFDHRLGLCNVENGTFDFSKPNIRAMCLVAVACGPCFSESACGGLRGSVEDTSRVWRCTPLSAWDHELTTLMLILLAWELGGLDPLSDHVVKVLDELVAWSPVTDSLVTSGHLAAKGGFLNVKMLTYASEAVGLGAVAKLVESTKDAFDRYSGESFGWLSRAVAAMRAARLTGLTLFQAFSDGGEVLRTLLTNNETGLGIPLARASFVIASISEFVHLSDPSIPPSLDVCSSYYGSPTSVFAEVRLNELGNLDEASYTFEARFSLLISWVDDRQRWLPASADIDACIHPCSQTGRLLCCDKMWYPTLRASNAIEWQSMGADDAGGLEWPPATVGMGVHALDVKAIIGADGMDFRSFPHDTQTLNVTFSAKQTADAVVLKPSLSASSLLLRQSATRGTEAEVGALHARGSWRLLSAKISANETSGGHASMLMAATEHAAPGNPIAYLKQEGGASEQSSFRLALLVKRDPTFYELNIVVPVVILAFLSWFTFFLPPVAVEDRLMVVLTSVLALIAFQFVMNDSLPRTGYQTRLHRFIMYANGLIALAACESVVVYFMATAAGSSTRSKHSNGGNSKLQTRWRRMKQLLGGGGGAPQRSPIPSMLGVSNRVVAYAPEEPEEPEEAPQQGSAPRDEPEAQPVPTVSKLERKSTMAQLGQKVRSATVLRRVHTIDLTFAALFPVLVAALLKTTLADTNT